MLRMIGPDQALALVLNNAEPLPPNTVRIQEALGLTLAEEIHADRPHPPFDRAMMDGYAVRLADAGGEAEVAGQIAAGDRIDKSLEDGVAYAIMTGAPCPPGTEAVVPMERVSCKVGSVCLPDRIAPGEHVAPMGSECGMRQVVGDSGDRITPLVIANLATFGYTHLLAVPRPVCAVITTGAEFADTANAPDTFQIRDANGPMLAALLHEAGIRQIIRCHAEDTLESLEDALEKTDDAEVVLLTGGVSVGAYDLVPKALEVHGVQVLFHKVTQKPGKPLLFGRLGRRLFFGLPGNPLAAHLGFHRYVLPALLRMSGGSSALAPSTHEGRLTRGLRGAGARTLFQLCRVGWSTAGWRVEPLPGKGSADIFTVATANAYVRIEPNAGPRPAGEQVAFNLLEATPL